MQLDIYNGTALVGVLDQTEINRFVFTYLPGTAPGQAISLLMPVRSESWVHTELHPVFQVSLPEGYLRDAMTKLFSKHFGQFGETELLATVGANLIGRIRATPAGSGLSEDLPADSLDKLLASPKSALLKHYFGERVKFYGVSGAFPKFLSKSPAQKALKATLAFDRWIVKIDNDATPCLSLNEFFGLTAAQRAGLTVPEFHLSKDGTHLVIKRFDVDDAGERLGFEDLCALFGLPGAQKYAGSVERVIKTLRTWCAPAADLIKARDQFFAQYVLASVLRNGDAHLKNFGLLYQSEKKVWMAPVYDMLSMGIYAPRTQDGDAGDTMALSFNGTKRWMTGTAIDELAAACMIPSRRKTEIIARLGAALRATAADVERHIKAQPAFFAVAGCRMLELWSHGAASIDAPLSAHLRSRWQRLGKTMPLDAPFPPKRVRQRW